MTPRWKKASSLATCLAAVFWVVCVATTQAQVVVYDNGPAAGEGVSFGSSITADDFVLDSEFIKAEVIRQREHEYQPNKVQ